MTNDKVRQDFEDWCTHQVGEVPYDWAAAQWGVQYGRAAERAEIREKLESEGVINDVASALHDYFYNEAEQKSIAKAAITKILEVI